MLYYLNELSEIVRQNLRDGANPDDAAARALESSMFPNIAEFKRVRKLEASKRFSKYLSGFINIDASFGSPKFWYQFFHALFGAATNALENKQSDSSNQIMAFRLLAKMSERSA